MQFEDLCRPAEEETLVRSTLDALLNGDAEGHKALLAVPEDAFVNDRARDVWAAAKGIYRTGKLPDYPALKRFLGDHGCLRTADAWFQDYMRWLDSGEMDHVPDSAQSILNLYQRRKLYRLAVHLQAQAVSPVVDHVQLAQETSAEALRVVAGGVDEPVLVGDLLAETVSQNLKFREDQGEAGKSVWFGLPTLDGPTDEGGIPGAPGQVIIVAARPGVGKTNLMTHLTCSSLEKGAKVLMCSLEMNRWEVGKCIAAWQTLHKRGAFWAGHYNAVQVETLKNRRVRNNQAAIWDPARPTWSRLEAKIRGAAQAGYTVAVIDHFSEINVAGLAGQKAKPYENAKECAQRIKALAKELGICIVLLAQFNREIPRGEAPSLEHLRETGELEQIAYSVLALYREAVPTGAPKTSKDLGASAPPPSEPVLKISILKNREGKAGISIKLLMDGSTCQFLEPDFKKAAV